MRDDLHFDDRFRCVCAVDRTPSGYDIVRNDRTSYGPISLFRGGLMSEPSGTSKPTDDTPWPKWRIRLARLSPYTIDIPQQLKRLRQLTLGLTIVPAFMGTIVFTLLSVFGRPDIGAMSVCLIFGPMIALAWWDYVRIARQARAHLAAQPDAGAGEAGMASAESSSKV